MINIKHEKELLDKIYNELSIEELQELLNFLDNNWWDLNKIKDFEFKDYIKYLGEKDKKKLIKIIKKVLTILSAEKAIIKAKWWTYIRKKVSRNSWLYIILWIIVLIIIFYIKIK